MGPLCGSVVESNTQQHTQKRNTCKMPAKLTADRQSAASLLKAAKSIKKATNDTWGLAPKAPMFQRKTKTSAGKKKIVRTKRVIGTHAFRVAASGAAAYASAVLQRESKALRVEMTDESKRCPWLPSVTKGAIAVLESFLTAYAQEATRHAVSIKTGLGTSEAPMYKRLNGRLMRMGYEAADKAIFGSASPAPGALTVLKLLKKEKKGKADDAEEEKDYAPPEAE